MRFAVRDQPALERTFGGHPGAHAGGAARAVEIDGRAAAEAELHALARPVLLVGAPAQLGGLQRFAHERAARPGVDELAPLLAAAADLAVALGDLHRLHAELHGEARPLLLGSSAPAGRRRCPARC